jgi:DNA repair exonuclease SbcCD ATPase subunit
MLDLPEDSPEAEEDPFVQEITEPTRVNPALEDTIDDEVASEADTQVEQRIISAQETQEHLEQLKQQEIEAQQQAEQARIEAQQAEEKALAAEQRAQEEQSQQQAEERQREAEQARIEAQQAEEKARAAEQRAQEEQEKAEQKAQEIQQAVEEEEIFTCRADQCAFNDQCWTKPANASCAADDTNNAWTCNEGYEEKNGTCAKKQLRTISNAVTPKDTDQILEQWYFNPHKVDNNVHGR